MRRYLGLFGLFVRNSILVDMEYRVNFAGSIVAAVMDVVWSIGGTLVFYSHRRTIGGWTLNEALVVIGLFFVTVGLLDAFVQPNMRDIVEAIRKGTMDFVLTKPVNSQVHATLRRYRFERLSSVLVGLGIVAYALAQLGVAPTPQQWLLAGMIFAGAALALYAAMVILAGVAFWAVESNNIDEFVFGFLDAARYPADAFPSPLRGLFLFVVPVAFVTTVPAQVLLGRVTPVFVFYGWVFALVLLIVSARFWRLAVRHYSSASS